MSLVYVLLQDKRQVYLPYCTEYTESLIPLFNYLCNEGNNVYCQNFKRKAYRF
jgi:hypothetical protein